MRKLFLKSLTILLCISFIACNHQPQPISYGNDNCEYCKMTIVDTKFGAELVTEKGKIYKFDSGECMIRWMKKNKSDDQNNSTLLITDHQTGKLIDAKTANYLVSENLPSPMGDGLSAFGNKSDLEKFKDQYNGLYCSWDEVQKKIE